MIGAAVRAVGQPVKSIEDRLEHLTASVIRSRKIKPHRGGYSSPASQESGAITQGLDEQTERWR
jgi:hypothetical protein